jgi:competence protein ComFB
MKNVSENAIRSVYESLLKSQAGFCTCERCREDVVTLALNNTRPRYVSGAPGVGEVVTGVNMSLDRARAELTVVVLDAMRKVSANPRHAP